MDLNFTDEQNMMRDGLSRLIVQKYSFDDRKKAMKDGFWRQDMWAEFAEMGLLMAPLPEEMGGLGGGAIDSMIIAEEMGKGLVLEPFLQSAVCSGALLNAAGSDAQKSEHGEKITTGEAVYAPALYEKNGRFDANYVQTNAKKDGNGYVLSGQKSVVMGGAIADVFIVSARTTGSANDKDGISLFIVPKSAIGVVTKDYVTVDGLNACELILDNAVIGADALLGEEGKASGLIAMTIDHGIAAICAEAVGIMAVMTEQTKEYAKGRKQFGVPISTFQVLQHAMVNMLIATEEAKSMALLAAIECDENDPSSRAKACAAAKVKIGQSARIVGQNAIQIHGGMGMTDEMPISHYFKRLTMIDMQFGNVDYWLRRYGEI